MGNKTALAALTIVLLVTSFSQAQLFRRFRPQPPAAQFQQLQQFRYPTPNCNQANQAVRLNYAQIQQSQTRNQPRGFYYVIPANQYQALLRQRQQEQLRIQQLANRPFIQRPQYVEPGNLSVLPNQVAKIPTCLLYTSPSPRDLSTSRMPSSA